MKVFNNRLRRAKLLPILLILIITIAAVVLYSNRNDDYPSCVTTIPNSKARSGMIVGDSGVGLRITDSWEGKPLFIFIRSTDRIELHSTGYADYFVNSTDTLGASAFQIHFQGCPVLDIDIIPERYRTFFNDCLELAKKALEDEILKSAIPEAQRKDLEAIREGKVELFDPGSVESVRVDKIKLEWNVRYAGSKVLAGVGNNSESDNFWLGMTPDGFRIQSLLPAPYEGFITYSNGVLLAEPFKGEDHKVPTQKELLDYSRKCLAQLKTALQSADPEKVKAQIAAVEQAERVFAKAKKFDEFKPI